MLSAHVTKRSASESWIGKDVKGNGRCVISCAILEFTWRDWGNREKVRLASYWRGIWTRKSDGLPVESDIGPSAIIVKKWFAYEVFLCFCCQHWSAAVCFVSKTAGWILLKYGVSGFTLKGVKICEVLTGVTLRCAVGEYRRFGGTNCLLLQDSSLPCHRKKYREYCYFNLTCCKFQCQFAVRTALWHGGHANATLAVRLGGISMIQGLLKCFSRLVGYVSHQRYSGKLLCVMSQLYPAPITSRISCWHWNTPICFVRTRRSYC